jgi:hypothetical protein
LLNEQVLGSVGTACETATVPQHMFASAGHCPHWLGRWHTLPSHIAEPVQRAHAAPPVPHAPFALPSWHFPLASQQPFGQVVGSQAVHAPSVALAH